MSVQGVKEIQRAITAHKKKTAKGLRVGLLRAGLFLQRESQEIVPFDKGFLKASGGARYGWPREEGVGFDIAVAVGYSANYALYVHENLTARHDPGKQAKFLEQPLREKMDRIGAIVVEAVERAG